MKIINRGDVEINIVNLSEASRARFCGKTIQTEVIVIGKNLTPYIVPERIEMFCQNRPDKTTVKCGQCPMNIEGSSVKEMKDEKELLLELFECTTAQQIAAIKRHYNMVKCESSHMKVKGTLNIEYVICIPQVRTESKYVTMGMYYQGHGMETNKSYLVTGVVVAHPRTQAASIIIKEIEELQGGLDKFVMTDILREQLKIFQIDQREVTRLPEVK